jgi:hypothetical protein
MCSPSENPKETMVCAIAGLAHQVMMKSRLSSASRSYSRVSQRSVASLGVRQSKLRTFCRTTREGSSGSNAAVGSSATSGCQSRSFVGRIVIHQSAKIAVAARPRPSPARGPRRRPARNAPRSAASQRAIQSGAGLARSHRAEVTTAATASAVTARSSQPAHRNNLAAHPRAGRLTAAQARHGTPGQAASCPAPPRDGVDR